MEINKDRGWGGLPAFSKALFNETYLLDGETYDMWTRRMSQFSKSSEQARRLRGYLSNYWMAPSTPISSNGGTDRGMPIACMVQHVGDSRDDIFESWKEASWVGSEGTGLGRYWGDVREIGSPVADKGGSSGVIPFMVVDEALTKAISQGSIRRMSIADYLPIWHPEIREFLELRSPNGDRGRRAPELHHAVVIDDLFMESLITDTPYALISPKTREVIEMVSPKEIWEKLLEIRTTLKGEPYLMFVDTVNKQLPIEYSKLGLKVSTMQLCNEIAQHTAPDYTAVCCLASANVEYWEEWKDDKYFLGDMSDFLDEVLSDFLRRTEGKKGFENSRRATINERNIGIGVMGYHGLLQSKSIPFDSAMAYGLNKVIFKHIRESLDAHQASLPLSEICPMSREVGTHRRNILTMAVAPTMSISTLCNLATSGIEPAVANAFTKKVKQGSFAVQNKFLSKIIEKAALEFYPIREYGHSEGAFWVAEQWKSIKSNEGSVQHLEWMTDWDKEVFKTSFEIHQKHIVAQAGDRQEWIDQGQSLNIFVPGGSNVQYISDLHIRAWRAGVKGLYYLRSSVASRATTSMGQREKITTDTTMDELTSDACPSCA